MLEQIIACLIAVETGGELDPLTAVGDGGKAWGQLQIHQCVIDDVNKQFDTGYTHEDALKDAKSRQICQLYLKMWCTRSRLGRNPTPSDYARIWNGGPVGYRRDSTDRYAARFMGEWNRRGYGDNKRKGK